MDNDKYSPHELAFAREIARRRELRGWTLADMATALQREGIDYANTMTVSRSEKLQRPIRMNEAIAYARIFRTSVDQLTSTSAFDGEVAAANELVDMSTDFINTVIKNVGYVHWNWQAAKRVRDELLAHDETELTKEQQDSRARAVRRLDALIELDLIAELRRAWAEAPIQ